MIAIRNIVTCAVSALAVGQFLLCTTAQAGRGGLNVGDDMPEFLAVGIAGDSFAYKHGGGKALMVAFLSAEQERSTRAAADIEGMVRKLGADAERLAVVIVVDDAEGACFQSEKEGPAKDFRILLDAEYKLWGKFGIIAAPTVIIAGRDDKVMLVKAGYGYDFVPLVRSHLNQALGIAQAVSPEDARQVKTVTNDTVAAGAKRHLQMAKMLQQKGRLESAIAEVRKAKEMDPTSVEAALALGELLCRTNQSKAALNVIDKIKTTNKVENASVLLLSGWAKRQVGELDAAEKLLLEATTLDPRSTRALFELGKVYQARKQTDKAMRSYYRALALILGEPEDAKISRQ